MKGWQRKLLLFAAGGAAGALIAHAVERYASGAAGLLAPDDAPEVMKGSMPPLVRDGLRSVVRAGVEAWKDTLDGLEYLSTSGGSTPTDQPEVIVIPRVGGRK